MAILDISRTLEPSIAVWPGDTRFALGRKASLADGDSVNLTTLTCSAHTGTHADAHRHYTDAGPDLAGMPLLPYWGPCQVVHTTQSTGPLHPDAFPSHTLGQAPRLLLRTPLSDRDPHTFHRDFVYPSPEFAARLRELGVLLFGTDAPSVDHPDSKDLPGHHALLAANVCILEGLDLAGVDDGLYDLSALPLKIADGDGSPVRAALRTLDHGDTFA